MLTPAMTESSTSLPWVIIENAFCTAVTVPPFLNRLPLADETTTGFIGAGTSISGPVTAFDLLAASVNPAAAVVIMNSRRLIFLLMKCPLIEFEIAGPSALHGITFQ